MPKKDKKDYSNGYEFSDFGMITLESKLETNNASELKDVELKITFSPSIVFGDNNVYAFKMSDVSYYTNVKDIDAIIDSDSNDMETVSDDISYALKNDLKSYLESTIFKQEFSHYFGYSAEDMASEIVYYVLEKQIYSLAFEWLRFHTFIGY